MINGLKVFLILVACLCSPSIIYGMAIMPATGKLCSELYFHLYVFIIDNNQIVMNDVYQP